MLRSIYYTYLYWHAKNVQIFSSENSNKPEKTVKKSIYFIIEAG